MKLSQFTVYGYDPALADGDPYLCAVHGDRLVRQPDDEDALPTMTSGHGQPDIRDLGQGLLVYGYLHRRGYHG